MNEELKVLEDTIYNNPLALLALDNAEEIGLSVLPYSVGIEFECFKKDNYDEASFKAIPNILDVRVDSGEQRYRIPNGIKGLICLYNLCDLLQEYSMINEGSGNHCHCDFSECDFNFIDETFIKNNEDWVLKELDTWNYKGTYNARNFNLYKGGWAGFRKERDSLEFRIMEMSFLYPILLKRIVHICEISKKLKQNLEIYSKTKKYQDLLKKYDISSIKEIKKLDNIEEIIKFRKIKV